MNTNRQYLAGYFDGEGCIQVRVVERQTKTSCTVSIDVSQKGGIGLDGFKRRYKGNIYGPNAKGVFNWRCNGAEAIKFLEEVLPLLTVKHDKAKEAIELWDKYH